MDHSKNDLGLLVMRIALGSALLAHGLMKYFVFTLPGTVGFFESLGIPGFMAYLVFLGEVGGGLFILLGIQTRLMAALMVPILVGATVVHIPNGWSFSAQGGGWEYPAFLTAASIALALTGEGSVSLGKRLFAKTA